MKHELHGYALIEGKGYIVPLCSRTTGHRRDVGHLASFKRRPRRALWPTLSRTRRLVGLWVVALNSVNHGYTLDLIHLRHSPRASNLSMTCYPGESSYHTCISLWLIRLYAVSSHRTLPGSAKLNTGPHSSKGGQVAKQHRTVCLCHRLEDPISILGL